jgi:hypothetical protein
MRSGMISQRTLPLSRRTGHTSLGSSVATFNIAVALESPGAELGQGFVAALAVRNAVPAQHFSDVAAVHVRQRVQPVKAGNRVLNFEVMETAGRQNEPSVSMLSCQFYAGAVYITECQPKSEAGGSQAFSRTGSVLCHGTTLLASLCVIIEALPLVSIRRPRPLSLTNHRAATVHPKCFVAQQVQSRSAAGS